MPPFLTLCAKGISRKSLRRQDRPDTPQASKPTPGST